MRDLLLWRLLHEDVLDAEVTAPLLAQLTALHLRERFPFFGVLERALTHAEPSLRAGAIAALRGADGLLAFRALVSALDDNHPSVRLAAVDALRESAAGHPMRWAHALFHPRADVRVAAAATPGPPAGDGLALHLVADDACREVVLARVASWAGETSLLPRERVAPLAPPPAAFPTLIALTQQGAIPRALARRALAAVPWDDALRWLEAGRRRADEDIATLLGRGDERELAVAAGSDAFDELLELVWPDADGSMDERSVVLLHRMASAMPSWPAPTQRRLTAAIVAVAARERRLPDEAAEICAVYHPRFLTFGWLAPSVRRRALRGLYAAGAGVPRRDDAEVRALLADPLFLRPTGALDLWAVGAVLHLVRSAPYRSLRRWFGTEAIVAAFAEDIEGSAAFLALKDESKRGRRDLIERLCRDQPRRALALAVLALHAPADGLDFLGELSGEDAAEVVVEMLRLAAVSTEAAPSAGRPPRAGARLLGPSAGAAVRLAQALGAALIPDFVGTFLDAWLGLPACHKNRLGLELLGVVAGGMSAERFAEVAGELSLPKLSALLAALPHAASFPSSKEMALAYALREHADPGVAEWARERLPGAPGEVRRVRPPRASPLDDSIAARISSCAESDLENALGPCLEAPSLGVAAALAERPLRRPSVAACVALLGAHDPLALVDEVFATYCDDSPAFLGDVDAHAVSTWAYDPDLPALGHAWLHRWEKHALAFAVALHDEQAMRATLAAASGLRCSLLGAQIWDAAASVLAIWRWRDKARLAGLATDLVLDALVEGLAGVGGEAAARMLVLFADAGVGGATLEARRPRVLERLPDLTPETREALHRWIDSSGLVGQTLARRPAPAPPDAQLWARIRTSSDPEELAALLRAGGALAVQEAALRLVELGEAGTSRMVALLEEGVGSTAADAIIESLPLWQDGAARRAIAARVDAADVPAEQRFRLAMALFEGKDRRFLERALSIASLPLAPGESAWFRDDDWKRLLRLGATERALSLGLSASPHPHAYRAAVEHLLSLTAFGDPEIDAVHAFLEAGTARLLELRRRAARWLLDLRDLAPRGAHAQRLLHAVFPLALATVADYVYRSRAGTSLLGGADAALVREAVDALLFAGPRVVAELPACWLLETPDVDPVAAAEGFVRIAECALSDAVRARAVERLRHTPARPAKLRTVAEAFAWGILVGRQLTGRVYRVQMIGGQALGYTRFGEDRVYVNPLPLLRRIQHGRAIVEGLVLHELGHHLYHRGEEQERSWKQAQSEGLFGVLNLVADEHLERNLRALDASFGDRLKRLAAWAFHHHQRDIPVRDLAAALGARAFAVLSAAPLGVAREENCVQVASGAVLAEMERAGLSFVRFVRALRLGLGNRHGDPRVETALALFKGPFRRRSMPELLEIARRLRAIFGWEAQMAESFGGHETLPSDEGDRAVEGEGITAEELDAEIERVLDPRGRARAGAAAGGAGAGSRRWINVSPEERFETIDRVVPVPFDATEEARYSEQVARQARRMRQYLERLGISSMPRRMRLRGRFDPTRARALVLRGDPRMLVAREREVASDLFLGVLVDCSGSMQARGHIERAKLFGAMLAQAARGLRGVDLRIWGFTDRVIYDAGDADRCAAHGLRADGGNNDAAALWHAAQTALKSRRRAKLLVMISDGLPTECSAQALRVLARRLGARMGVCCAQVAVQPLAEVCFPHYVVLSDDSSEVAVRRFGGIVAGLVMRAMSRGL